MTSVSATRVEVFGLPKQRLATSATTRAAPSRKKVSAEGHDVGLLAHAEADRDDRLVAGRRGVGYAVARGNSGSG